MYPFLRFLFSYKSAKVIAGNIEFKNQIGLAAGFDKNGIAIGLWEALGFSHVEVGTVTPLAQPGNTKPRIFRLKKDRALINRLGFNNDGADAIRSNIMNTRTCIGEDFVIGVNIGKNRNTPIKNAYQDYRICFEKLYDAADYFTINISSPNTEGLRKLHEEQYLDELLSELQKLNRELSANIGSAKKNIFLKIAPDIDPGMIETVFSLSVKNNITGIIATNTTIDRPKLKTPVNEEGGLSGAPLKKTSDMVLKKLKDLNDKVEKEKQLCLIGVGGVFSQKDFADKIKYGGSLVQIYTGLVFEGPGLVKRILRNQKLS